MKKGGRERETDEERGKRERQMKKGGRERETDEERGKRERDR